MNMHEKLAYTITKAPSTPSPPQWVKTTGFEKTKKKHVKM